MGSRLKVMKLLLEDGTLDGLCSVDDSSWSIGEFYSCPRENIKALLEKKETDRYGIYLLLSPDMVYVGQSKSLKRRISEHLDGKPWWERAVLLTTKNDSFGKSDIDYLEFELIKKAKNLGTLDCDNKVNGNDPKVDKFRKAELDEYLDEALFILQFVGTTVFIKQSQKHKSAVVVPTLSTTMNKSETIALLEKNGINVTKPNTYASRQKGKPLFWMNPSDKYLDHSWMIILNDQFKREIKILQIPPNAFTAKRGSVPGNGVFNIRNDKDQLDIDIDSETMIETRSLINLSRFVTKTINY